MEENLSADFFFIVHTKKPSFKFFPEKSSYFAYNGHWMSVLLDSSRFVLHGLPTSPASVPTDILLIYQQPRTMLVFINQILKSHLLQKEKIYSISWQHCLELKIFSVSNFFFKLLCTSSLLKFLGDFFVLPILIRICLYCDDFIHDSGRDCDILQVCLIRMTVIITQTFAIFSLHFCAFKLTVQYPWSHY